MQHSRTEFSIEPKRFGGENKTQFYNNSSNIVDSLSVTNKGTNNSKKPMAVY
jgi:hypothetical protein